MQIDLSSQGRGVGESGSSRVGGGMFVMQLWHSVSVGRYALRGGGKGGDKVKGKVR